MKIPPKITKALSREQLSFLQAFFAKSPDSLLSCMMLKSYPENHTLISTDDSCSHVYILLKGRLQAIEERIADGPYNFTELSAIEIVGDFELFTRLSNRMITLTTLEPSLCLILPSTDYLDWIRSDANALFMRIQMIIHQMTSQAQFERQNLFLDNKTRFLHYLYGECLKQPESAFPLQIRHTRQEISGNLGCSVRTINRIVLGLQNGGILSLEHGKIKITARQYCLISEYVENALCASGHGVQ